MSNVADKPRLILLAGGKGRRLGGVDKALLLRDGVSQLDRWREYASQLKLPFSVSRRTADVPDSFADDTSLCATATPLIGLATACLLFKDEWFLSVPVDTVRLPPDLADRYAALDTGNLDKVEILDADGAQPLLAFWRRAALHNALKHAFSAEDYAVKRLVTKKVAVLELGDYRCGNINQSDDLARFDTLLP